MFTAVDIRATVETLRARGVEFTRDIIMHEYGVGDREGDAGDFEAEFTDPDGNQFLLHS